MVYRYYGRLRRGWLVLFSSILFKTTIFWQPREVVAFIYRTWIIVLRTSLRWICELEEKLQEQSSKCKSSPSIKNFIRLSIAPPWKRPLENGYLKRFFAGIYSFFPLSAPRRSGTRSSPWTSSPASCCARSPCRSWPTGGRRRVSTGP